MVQRQHAGGKAAHPPSSSRLGHWMRVIVMFLSFGMIYPNAMVEDMDVAKYDEDSKKQ